MYGFGAHYRIREERCVLGLVNIMAGLFQQDARYCEGIVQEWLPACHAAKDGRLTRNELALHCNIVVCKDLFLHYLSLLYCFLLHCLFLCLSSSFCHLTLLVLLL